MLASGPALFLAGLSAGVSARSSAGDFLAGLLDSLALALDHVLGAADFLLGGGRAGVDRVGLLEFEQRLAQLPSARIFRPLSTCNWAA